MLAVEELHKVYDGGGRRVEAIGDLTFEVDGGSFVCVVGPSGCGKTTLLRCCAGLLAPTSGSVTLSGAPVTGPPDGLAVVFQEYGRSLFPWLRVADNVDLPLRAAGIAKDTRRQLVAEALDAVGLADAHRAYPWQLSGGMQQRVAIARAIAYQPRVLLMDEPFAALDAQTREVMQTELLDIWTRHRKTVVFITHQLDEAVLLADRVIVMAAHPGRVREEIPIDIPRPRDLHTKRGEKFTQYVDHIWKLIEDEVRSSLIPGTTDPARHEV